MACEANEGSLTPQILFFVAQLIAGVGQTICSTLGISYMDDNIKKSKTPALMSKPLTFEVTYTYTFLIGISFFMRLLGPALGTYFFLTNARRYFKIIFFHKVTRLDLYA